jgi:eukaryotic-like serine/threonine-protein kinase
VSVLPFQFGIYLLESRLAVGGTSEVYLARPPKGAPLPDQIIVKRPLPQFQGDTSWNAMFAREARLQAMVRHPNVVRVFETGEVNGEPFLAMEHVQGIDGDRLARRLRQESARFSFALATHVACEVLAALESVHDAKDDEGRLLGLLHRDVTPSNVYFSQQGDVKLGDFGLAHSQHKNTFRSETGNTLKGKFAYLAPEQVAGDPVDHRADLFSLAVLYAEMLLGKPLFSQGGQLAVLLAIRDGKTDGVDELLGNIPAGLYDALKQALARVPGDRHPNAAAFRKALLPFATPLSEAKKLLSEKVRWVQSNPTARAMQAVRPSDPSGARDSSPEVMGTATMRFHIPPVDAILAGGKKIGPLSFAELVEALATGTIGRGDLVNYRNEGMKPVESYEELARFLPTTTARTDQVDAITPPDYDVPFSLTGLLEVLAHVHTHQGTGVLFAQRMASAAQPKSIRKELYFREGLLHHVASNDASELLGEYLVRRGDLAREELDMALAVLPRYQGRMGDTLIALGLVSPVAVFRAIREQGRDRVSSLFRWQDGTLTFYRDQTHAHVDFRLDLAIPQLMIAGLEAVSPGESPIAQYRGRLNERLNRVGSDQRLSEVLLAVHELVPPGGATLREVLAKAVTLATFSNGDTLRSIEVLIALGVLRWG